MAVVVDGVDNFSTASNATSATKSITLGSPTDALLVFVHLDPGASGDKATAVTWNGVALSEIVGCDSGDSSTRRIQAFLLLAPAPATADVVATISGAGSRPGMSIYRLSGVDQTTPTGDVDVLSSGSTDAPTLTVTGAAAGDLVIDAGSYGGSAVTVTVGADQTQRTNFTSGSVPRCFSSTEPGAASVTMSWGASTPQTVGFTALVLKAAGGGGGGGTTAYYYRTFGPGA